MNYLLAHWADIIAALTGIILTARLIVKLTPTPKDDTALESFVEALKHVGLVIKTPLIIACALCLTSCAVNSDGAKTFGGITGAGWLSAGKSAFMAAVPVAVNERSKFQPKNPIPNVQP
jgi:hypothetical protein